MYYVINDLNNPSIDEDEDDAPFLEIHEELIINPRRGWHSGAVLEDPPAQVVLIEATPHFGYRGPPPDYYDDSISLISPRLKKTFDMIGIDNIQYYPAVIHYRGTGESYDWFSFNIVGLISAVDFGKSDIKSVDGMPLINSSINGFTVDDKKTYGADIFRLAENVMTTLVSERVKNAIEIAGINTFEFTAPEDWIMI